MLEVPNNEFEFLALMLKFTGVALAPVPPEALTTALNGIFEASTVTAPLVNVFTL